MPRRVCSFGARPTRLVAPIGDGWVRGIRVPIAVAATVAFGSIGSVDAVAQNSSEPFQTLDVALHAVYDVNRTVFHEYWDPVFGLEASVATPFYVGAISLGGQVSRHHARLDDTPDFGSFLGYVGWGIVMELPSSLRAYAGVRTGLLRMAFDVEANRYETEVAAALEGHLDYAFATSWGVVLSGRYRTVFTRERWRLVFVGAGIRRSFAAPSWLERFLK